MKNQNDRWENRSAIVRFTFSPLRRNSYLDDPCYNTKSVDKNPQNDSGAVLPVISGFREFLRND